MIECLLAAICVFDLWEAFSSAKRVPSPLVPSQCLAGVLRAENRAASVRFEGFFCSDRCDAFGSVGDAAATVAVRRAFPAGGGKRQEIRRAFPAGGGGGKRQDSDGENLHCCKGSGTLKEQPRVGRSL